MAEVAVKLVDNHSLTGRFGANILRVNIRILSCPTYFNQIIFAVEAHPKSDPVAWVCIDYNARVSSCDVGLDWEAHAGAITEERGHIKTQGLLRLFLCIQPRGKRYQ